MTGAPLQSSRLYRVVQDRGLWALLALLLCIWGANEVLRNRYAGRKLFGDEPVYVAQAVEHSKDGWTTLLPGQLGLAKRPPLWGRVLSRVGYHLQPERDEDATEGGPSKHVLRTAYLRGGTELNLVLLCIALIATYAQARMLRLGPFGALLPVLLIATLPRLVFHVHSLWSEMLHMALQAIALAALLASRRSRTPTAWVIVAGLALGFAVLTRTTMLYFVPVALIWLGIAKERGVSITRRVLPAAAFALSFCSVVAPQLIANHGAGYGYRLAANSWLNIEIGLRRFAGHGERLSTHDDLDDDDEAPEKREPVERGTDAKLMRYVHREEWSKREVVGFLKNTPLSVLVREQAIGAYDVLVRKASVFETAVTRRFYGRRNAELEAIPPIDDVLWTTLLVLGSVALAWLSFRSWEWALLGLYFAYYCVGLMAAPIGSRVAFQLVPIVCLAAAALALFLGRKLQAYALHQGRPMP